MIPEELLRRAAARSCAEHVEELTADFDPEYQHEFSPEFEWKIKTLIRKTKHLIIYRTMQRVALVVLAVALAGAAWLTVDVEARAAFIGWVKEVYETFFVYRYEGSDMDADPARYHLTWIPEGYQEVFADLADGEGSAVYMDENGQYMHFTYVSNPDSSNVFVVTEGTTRSVVSVSGYHADFFASEDPEISNAIAWTDDESCAFFISGFLSKEDLIKIAENVEKVKISFE